MQTSVTAVTLTSLPCKGRTALHRCSRLLVRAEDDRKGFGTGSGQSTATSAAKVNKRGKVSSRSGQMSKKEQEKRAELMQELEQQQGQQMRASTSGRMEAEDAVVPEAVADRILKRILVFVGVPVTTGILLLPGFYYLKVVQGLDIPTWVVYTVQSFTFGAGLLGISYGILSTSWDPRREGSALGFTEFKANLPIVLDRFRNRVR